MAKSVLSAPHFHDEAAAFAYLENKLWPQGPVCPKCGGEGYPLQGVKDKKGRVRHGLKKCRACRAQFTVRIGTIFEDSHAPLHLWLQAIALLAASKKGISSNQLHRTLGVTLKTAWFMSHRIRMAMAPRAGSLPPIGGEGRVVEIDETYHGKVANPTEVRADGKPMKKKGQGTGGSIRNRRAILSLIERGGSARTFHVAEANMATVAKIVRENIDPRSRIHTDGSNLYKGVGKEFADHQTVEHTMDEYVRWDENGAIHNNSCESYFSVYKTRVALGMDDQDRAEQLITQVVGKRLTYQTGDRPA
jgi:transposase-like protein